MKGPRSRHRFCVLRVWECPLCMKRALAPVQAVTRACECQGKDRPTWMRLMEESRVRRAKPEAAEPPPTSDLQETVIKGNLPDG
jgi:hypothetical protein